MSELTAPSVSPRLQLLKSSLGDHGIESVRSFWEEITERGTPIIEPDSGGYSLVTFLWRDDGIARNIAVLQDWGTDGIREHHMALLPGSDVWYVTRRMRSDTRTTYQLSPSSSLNRDEPGLYQVDPLNPKRFTAFLSEQGNDIVFSLLELPDAPALPWRVDMTAQRGTVGVHTPFADQRRLWVYEPPDAGANPLPLLVVFDGRLYKEMLQLPTILDYLIRRRDIQPVMALMVDNLDRRELECQPGFATYMAETVMPWLRSGYRVACDPHQNVIYGSSLGGLAATYLAYRKPQLFGRVFSQTGWFRWRPEGDPEHHWLARQLAASAKLPLEFMIQVGNLEVARMADGGPTQVEANRYMRDTLLAKGYAVSYQEYSGGHDASSLEYPLSQGLIELFTV
jgi:enterochelin esterase-like enzyme